MKINELVNERIKDNEIIFTEDELHIIKENDIILKKIYLLGVLDGNTIKSGQKSGQRKR